MSALHQLRIADWLKTKPTGQTITVSGWVRTKRGNKDIAFIALSDGSTINTLQIVAELVNFDEEIIKKIQTGCSLRVTGALVASQGAGQTVDQITR
jgi:asparaginyl-tRNA synthetase